VIEDFWRAALYEAGINLSEKSDSSAF